MAKDKLCYTCGIDYAVHAINDVPVCEQCTNLYFPDKKQKAPSLFITDTNPPDDTFDPFQLDLDWYNEGKTPVI